MFSVNLTFDKSLMMQFCYFILQKSPLLGHNCVSIQNSTGILLHSATAAASSTLVHIQVTLTVLQLAAMQQLSAKVFKLSFEYLHIYSTKPQNVAIFAEK